MESRHLRMKLFFCTAADRDRTIAWESIYAHCDQSRTGNHFTCTFAFFRYYLSATSLPLRRCWMFRRPYLSSFSVVSPRHLRSARIRVVRVKFELGASSTLFERTFEAMQEPFPELTIYFSVRMERRGVSFPIHLVEQSQSHVCSLSELHFSSGITRTTVVCRVHHPSSPYDTLYLEFISAEAIIAVPSR
jgi:hypothetical protein